MGMTLYSSRVPIDMYWFNYLKCFIAVSYYIGVVNVCMYIYICVVCVCCVCACACACVSFW